MSGVTGAIEEGINVGEEELKLSKLKKMFGKVQDNSLVFELELPVGDSFAMGNFFRWHYAKKMWGDTEDDGLDDIGDINDLGKIITDPYLKLYNLDISKDIFLGIERNSEFEDGIHHSYRLDFRVTITSLLVESALDICGNDWQSLVSYRAVLSLKDKKKLKLLDNLIELSATTGFESVQKKISSIEFHHEGEGYANRSQFVIINLK